MMAAILNSAIMDSAILHKKKLHSFILTQLDDGSHLEFCHLGFRDCHLGFRHLSSSLRYTQKYSHSTLTLTQTISTWNKLIHSHSTWWWQPSWILPSWIQPFWLQLIQSDSNLFILTQLDDGSHLEFCHLGFRHCHLGFSHLIIFLSNSLTLAKIGSPLILTQTNSIWLKLIHSDSTWWWQPSWTLPSWIHPFCTKRTSLVHSESTWWWQPSWILPSWIQTPCYLLFSQIHSKTLSLHSDSDSN